MRRDSAAELSEQTQSISAPVQDLCGRLVKAQKASWNAFLGQSNLALGGLWRSSIITLLLLLALAVVVFLLVYRATVAPLRHQLTETRSVLERQILQTVRDLMTPQLEARGVKMVLETGERVRVRADKRQIEQVLINLVQNAADSLDAGGIITLRWRQGAARLAGQSAPAVILEVADTGKGIPLDVQKRMFDPFFSTKAAGTGLGLSISERIVEKHGGLIQYGLHPVRERPTQSAPDPHT